MSAISFYLNFHIRLWSLSQFSLSSLSSLHLFSLSSLYALHSLYSLSLSLSLSLCFLSSTLHSLVCLSSITSLHLSLPRLPTFTHVIQHLFSLKQENSQALIPSEEQYQAYLQIHPHTQRSIPPPDLQTFTFGSTFPPSDPWSSYAVERKPFFPTDPSHHFSCLQLPHALLDLPLIPDTHHLATDFDGVDFDPVALSQNVPEFDLSVDRLPPETGGAVGSIPPPADGFFGDFPLEMLDGLDQPPSSSPP